MFGTIVNFLSIIIGSLLGLILKKGIKEKYKEVILSIVPITIIFLGLSTTLSNMPKSEKPILFIISLVLGGLIGQWLEIEYKLEIFSQNLEKRFLKNSENNSFAKGFLTSSLLFCVGTMAILGSLDGGLKNNYGILYTKSILDGITSIILSSTFGIGVLFSSFAVLLYQGTITIFAKFLGNILTANMLVEISIIGGILLFTMGLSMLHIKKFKTINFLPSILIPIFYYIIFK